MLVPEELINHIFSFLHGESSALEACSEAHPILSRLAEPHLYADIIVPTNDICRVEDLYDQFCTNPHMLDFPRVLRFDRNYVLFHDYNQLIPITRVMLMIPQMVNLTSLSFQAQPWSGNLYEEFLRAFGTCLQQSSVETVGLEEFHNFPLALLDNGKNIKTLVLFDCTMLEDGPMLSLGSLHESLQTLIIDHPYNAGLLVWAKHRATSLTTLGLHDSRGDLPWDSIHELLTACSNLTLLNFDCAKHFQSVYLTDQSLSTGLPVNGRWVDDGLLFPFALSGNKHLTKISISAELNCDSNWKIYCALPAMIHLIKSAPSIADVEMLLHRNPLYRETIDPLDLSPLLDRLRSDFPANGTRPRIDLRVNDHWGDPSCDIIPDVLNGLVNEDAVGLAIEG